MCFAGTGTRGWTGGREVAVTTKGHCIEPFSGPAHIFLPILCDCQPAQLMRGKLQFVPVVCQPMLYTLRGMNNRITLRRRWRGRNVFMGGNHVRYLLLP